MHHSAPLPPPPPPPPYGAEVKPADMFAYAPSASLGVSTASGYSAAPGTSPLYPHGPVAGVPLLQPFLNPFAAPNGSGATAVPVAAPLLPSLVTSAPLSIGQPHATAQPQQAAQQFYPMAATQLPAQPQQLQTNLLSQQQLQQLQIQLQLQQLQQQQQQIQQLQQQQQQQQQQYAALQQRLAGNGQAIMLVPIGVDQTGVQQFLPQFHPGFPTTAAAAGGLALPPECPMSRAGFNGLGALGGGGLGVPLIPAGGIAPTPPPLAALPAHAAAAAAAAAATAAAQFHGATPNGSITSYRNTGGHNQAMGGVAPPGMQRCPVGHDSASRTAAHNHRSSLRQRRRQALIADYEKLEAAATAAGAGDPNFFVPLTGDVHRQALQRRKQVLFGRATRGYIHYLLAVPPTWRQRAAPAVPDAAASGCPFRHGGATANGEDVNPLSLDLSASFSVTGRSAAAPAHPRTPRSDLRCSKRSWDAVVGRWRAQLRQWDNPLFAADAVGTALKAFGVEPPGLTPVRESPQTATGTAANTAPAAPRATGCPVLAAINEAEKAESVRSGGSTPSLSVGRPSSLGGPAHPLFPAAYVRRLYPHVVHFLREVQRLFPPRSDGPEGEAAAPAATKPRRTVGDESSEDEEESMSQSSVSVVPPQQRVSLLPADIEALFAALGRVEEPDDADDERIVAKHRAVERLMEELSRAVMDASSALTES